MYTSMVTVAKAEKVLLLKRLRKLAVISPVCNFLSSFLSLRPFPLLFYDEPCGHSSQE